MAELFNQYHRHNVPTDAVNIMRPGKWGNPFSVGNDGTRDEVVDKHWALLMEDSKLRQQVRAELKGKDLVCCCWPRRCHGDNLLKVANATDEVVDSWVLAHSLSLEKLKILATQFVTVRQDLRKAKSHSRIDSETFTERVEELLVSGGLVAMSLHQMKTADAARRAVGQKLRAEESKAWAEVFDDLAVTIEYGEEQEIEGARPVHLTLPLSDYNILQRRLAELKEARSVGLGRFTGEPQALLGERQTWPKVPAKFAQSSVVRHRKGGLYEILLIPRGDAGADHAGTYKEDSGEPVYVYRALIDDTCWVRPQRDMEDGRFELVEMTLEQAEAEMVKGGPDANQDPVAD